MGWVIKREVVAIRCELATPRRGRPQCEASAIVRPSPADDGWEERAADLRDLVEQGWAFVLNARLRGYCPEHAPRAWDCTCWTHRSRKHLCTVHGDAAELVWTGDSTPVEALDELARIGAGA